MGTSADDTLVDGAVSGLREALQSKRPAPGTHGALLDLKYSVPTVIHDCLTAHVGNYPSYHGPCFVAYTCTYMVCDPVIFHCSISSILTSFFIRIAVHVTCLAYMMLQDALKACASSPLVSFILLHLYMVGGLYREAREVAVQAAAAAPSDADALGLALMVHALTHAQAVHDRLQVCVWRVCASCHNW